MRTWGLCYHAPPLQELGDMPIRSTRNMIARCQSKRVCVFWYNALLCFHGCVCLCLCVHRCASLWTHAKLTFLSKCQSEIKPQCAGASGSQPFKWDGKKLWWQLWRQAMATSRSNQSHLDMREAKLCTLRSDVVPCNEFRMHVRFEDTTLNSLRCKIYQIPIDTYDTSVPAARILSISLLSNTIVTPPGLLKWKHHPSAYASIRACSLYA